MLVFRRHDEPKVTIFGSARMADGDPDYELAESFARTMAARHWGVVTGAGPGIMEAGNRGAGVANGYGVNIRLPFEVESAKIEARYQNGMLNIRLPRREATKPRKIEIATE